MNKVLAIIRKKPLLFLLTSLAYLFGAAFLKWQIHPPLNALWFLVGGLLGVYFLDAAEEFVALSPSPFRSVVFTVLFVIVSFFVVTSSGSLLASGLVLSLYLSLLVWQIGEWQVNKNLSTWYRMVAGPVSVSTQRVVLVVCIIVFFIESYLFIR